jgi:hypothetical protein
LKTVAQHLEVTVQALRDWRYWFGCAKPQCLKTKYDIEMERTFTKIKNELRHKLLALLYNIHAVRVEMPKLVPTFSLEADF